MDEARDRRHYTRGFAQAVGWGAAVLLGSLFVSAASLWTPGADARRAELMLAGIAVLAAGAGGALAASRLPRHPVAFEGMRNGAIAGLGVVGVSYLVTLLLAFSARNGWDRSSPVGFVPFGAFFLGWLLPMGIGAALGGGLTGRFRSRKA